MFACCNTQFGTYKMFPVDLLYDSEEGSMSMEIGVEFNKRVLHQAAKPTNTMSHKNI